MAGVLMFVMIMMGVNGNAWAISRADFPTGFVFGTASSAYQVCFGYLLFRKELSLLKRNSNFFYIRNESTVRPTLTFIGNRWDISI